jgi:hypothetical protein
MLKMHEQIPWSRGREVSGGQRAEHPLAAMHREMDRLLDEFWRGFDLPAWNRGERPGMISPRIEVRDTDEAIIVTAELPGLVVRRRRRCRRRRAPTAIASAASGPLNVAFPSTSMSPGSG